VGKKNLLVGNLFTETIYMAKNHAFKYVYDKIYAIGYYSGFIALYEIKIRIFVER
jgi:hypothetical protein